MNINRRGGSLFGQGQTTRFNAICTSKELITVLVVVRGACTTFIVPFQF